MKKKVVLYVRVSTDEQRDKGYSLRDQELRLIKECERKDYEVVKVYREDYSAKDFSSRPEWQKFVRAVKSKTLDCDILFCTKPDRLSRNLLEYLNEKTWLQKYDILIKFLEGDIDHEDPNSFLMEILNNAIPQIDNMHRSINVTRGMRQAMKEGRYVNIAPLGYKNSNGTIIPNENAPFVIKAFTEVSKGLEAPEVIRKRLIAEGYKGCQRNNFYKILRNKLYCGQIFIKEYKNEEATTIDGIHEPLISKELFYNVQDILLGRGRKSKKYSKISPHTPLRGSLYCLDCGQNLTSSTSTNKKKILIHITTAKKDVVELTIKL